MQLTDESKSIVHKIVKGKLLPKIEYHINKDPRFHEIETVEDVDHIISSLEAVLNDLKASKTVISTIENLANR